MVPYHPTRRRSIDITSYPEFGDSTVLERRSWNDAGETPGGTRPWNVSRNGPPRRIPPDKSVSAPTGDGAGRFPARPYRATHVRLREHWPFLTPA